MSCHKQYNSHVFYMTNVSLTPCGRGLESWVGVGSGVGGKGGQFPKSKFHYSLYLRY